MKRVILSLVFICSIAMNVGGLVVLGWHWWYHDHHDLTIPRNEFERFHQWFHDQRLRLKDPGSTQLSAADLQKIREIWSSTHPGELRKSKEKIRNKTLEILGLLADSPVDQQAVDRAVDELVALKGERERETEFRLQQVVSALPEAKKKVFLEYLSYRVRKHGRMPPRTGPYKPDVKTSPGSDNE